MNVEHLAWPFFDERHRSLAVAFADWGQHNLREFLDNEGGDGVAARTIFARLGKGGWLTRTVPLTKQGNGSPALDLRGICLLREISGYESAIADVALSEPWLGMLPIVLAGSPIMKASYLDRYLRGELLPAFALSEPDAGSDAAAIKTTAHRDKQGYVLNGQKMWTSNVGLADLYIVFAQTIEGDESRGISAFVVEPDDGGIVLEERIRVLPPHTVGRWRLENCRIPEERLLGGIGQGFKIAMKALELFRPTVGAATLGFARKALHEALRHSTARVAFKKPIAEHQLIQAKLAEMAVQVDAAALLIYRCAYFHDVGIDSLKRDAAMAKLYASEAAHDVIDEALQIFGGMGVVRGTVVERLYRHARAFRIFDGTSEIQKLIIARELLREWPHHDASAV